MRLEPWRIIYFPYMAQVVRDRPELFFIAVINMLLIANIPREISRGRDGWAFISSCGNIICLMALYGIGTYPNVIRASNAPDTLSLTIYNSASSQKTLEILLLIAIIGIPLVLAYTITIYKVFYGKVKIDPTSY